MLPTQYNFAKFASDLFRQAAEPTPGQGLVFDDKRFSPDFHYGLHLDVPTQEDALKAASTLFAESAVRHQERLSLADLQWLKHIVKVLRVAGCTQLSHTQALNTLATSFGFRSFGALQSRVVARLESVQTRNQRLPALAVLAVYKLQVVMSDDEFKELVFLALGIPCFEYEFRGYFEPSPAPVLRMYCNGAAHVREGTRYATLYGYSLEELKLCPVDYAAKPLPDVSDLEGYNALTSEKDKTLVRMTLWTSNAMLDDQQLRKATDEKLEHAFESNLPMSHHVQLTHRANAQLHPGHDTVVVGLSAFYDGAVGVVSAVPDGHSLFSSEPDGAGDMLALTDA